MGLLSKRLAAAAELVPDGSVLLDIGTDHGYLPIALLKENRIPSALAFDVREGPLQAAKEHILEAGLDSRIILRLSDGFEALKYGEADTVTILGMGGGLIRRILNDGDPNSLGIRECILGPQSEQKELRSYLTGNGYQIRQECYVRDSGKFYVLIRAVFGEETPYSEQELLFGRSALQAKDPVLFQYLTHRETVLRNILSHLPENPAGELRKEELEEELALVTGCIATYDHAGTA